MNAQWLCNRSHQRTSCEQAWGSQGNVEVTLTQPKPHVAASLGCILGHMARHQVFLFAATFRYVSYHVRLAITDSSFFLCCFQAHWIDLVMPVWNLGRICT
jgi:hypothetical protein